MTAGDAKIDNSKYKHFFGMKAKMLTPEEAVERTITGTRRYVRRQRSWFKRDPRITWFAADTVSATGVCEALHLDA